MLLQSPPDSPEEIFMEAAKSNILGLPSDASEKEKNVRAWLCRPDADYEDKLLACGAIIVAQLRVRVLEETQFTCSAGIAHNKDDLGVETIGDLLSFTEEKLQEQYGVNTGTWLWKIARGISGEEVEDRLLPKSHGCGKTFPGPKALKNSASVKGWLDQLCEELSERIQSDLNQNKRIAQTLTLHARASKANERDSTKKFPSKSCPLRYGTGKIQEDAMKLFESGLHDFLESQNTGWSITSLSVTASKIFDIPSGTSSILRYIKGPSSAASQAIPDFSSVPEDPSLDNNVYATPIHEEKCEPSTSENEDGERYSDISAKQCPTSEEKRISKKLPEVKGTSSILKFLSRGQSALHEKRKSDGLICSPQGPGSSSEANKAEEHNVAAQRADRSNINSGTEPSASNAWMFNVEDIDPAVVEELPPEIQREIQGWIRPSKQPSTKRRGSTISSYFPPARS
ncbi:unnamed protein product [Urochloa decumbens]|uniref:DNA polymerase Y-family little finger domain-containing protein n=1 Tax=Urochloa decumbens TaxID=240449 RepID=A0ABC8YQU7_9POAL